MKFSNQKLPKNNKKFFNSKLIIASVSAVLVTASLISKAKKSDNENLYSFEMSSEHADLERPEEFIIDSSELSTMKDVEEALKNEKEPAVPDSEEESTKAPVEVNTQKYFLFNQNAGMTFISPKCRRFLNADGTYGDFGRIIEDYFSTEKNDSILFSNDIFGMVEKPKICPNWRTFKDEEKVKFWVWTLASIALAESSCNANPKKVYGPTDTTAGLLQLEEGTRLVKGKKLGLALRLSRGPNCKVSSKDIVKPYSNLRCGLDMMKQQLTSESKDGELIFDHPLYPGKGMSAKSYWLKLRKENGGLIGNNMRRFTPCYE